MWPRYFVEVNRSTRVVIVAHVITYNAILDRGDSLGSYQLENDMVELTSGDIANAPAFPDVVETHKLDANDNLVSI